MRRAGGILVVGHDDLTRAAMAEPLADEGYQVRVALCVRAALRAIEDDRPELVVLDLDARSADGLDGLDGLREIGLRFPGVGVIVVGAGTNVAVARAALTLGAVDYVFKPFERERLSRAALIGRIRALDTTAAGRRLPDARAGSALKAETTPRPHLVSLSR